MLIIRWGHETEIVDIDWCWKPYLPYGKVSIIEGDGGDGKTTMILTVAALLSQGIQPPVSGAWSSSALFHLRSHHHLLPDQ